MRNTLTYIEISKLFRINMKSRRGPNFNFVYPPPNYSFIFSIAWSKLWNGQRGSKRQLVVNLLGNISRIFWQIIESIAKLTLIPQCEKRFGILGLHWAFQLLWGAREIDTTAMLPKYPKYPLKYSNIGFQPKQIFKLSNNRILPITAIVKIHRKRRSRTIATYLDFVVIYHFYQT